jgi:hypothetical protein
MLVDGYDVIKIYLKIIFDINNNKNKIIYVLTAHNMTVYASPQ